MNNCGLARCVLVCVWVLCSFRWRWWCVSAQMHLLWLADWTDGRSLRLCKFCISLQTMRCRRSNRPISPTCHHAADERKRQQALTYRKRYYEFIIIIINETSRIDVRTHIRAQAIKKNENAKWRNDGDDDERWQNWFFLSDSMRQPARCSQLSSNHEQKRSTVSVYNANTCHAYRPVEHTTCPLRNVTRYSLRSHAERQKSHWYTHTCCNAVTRYVP